MLKKLIILPTFLLLTACSTLSTDDDLSNAVDRINNKPSYFEVVGQSVEPDNLSENGSGLMKSSLVITAYVAKEGKSAPNSQIKMTISYLENYKSFVSAVVNGNEVKLKNYKVSTSMCTENCTSSQYITFPVKNEDLLKSIKSAFTFELHQTQGGKTLKFSVPGGYIGALLNSYEVNSMQTAKPAATAVVMQSKETASPLKMTQDLFVKASDAEKEQFTDWAFKNRKSIKTELNGKGKILPMLEYWFEKASEEERAEILTWVLAQ